MTSPQVPALVDRETVRFVRDYPHPPALVWAALTEPAQLGVWLWPCTSFEAKLGGVGVFDPGREFRIQVTEFEPQRLLNLGGLFRFELAAQGSGCRLTVDLKRQPDGWSPMGLAGLLELLEHLENLVCRTVGLAGQFSGAGAVRGLQKSRQLAGRNDVRSPSPSLRDPPSRASRPSRAGPIGGRCAVNRGAGSLECRDLLPGIGQPSIDQADEFFGVVHVFRY